MEPGRARRRGPHSFALGALLAGRCRAVAAIASPTPWDAEGIDQLAGTGEQNVEEFSAALEGADAVGLRACRLARRIPGVEAHVSEADGHLSIAVGRLGEIYDWLRQGRPTGRRS